MTNEFIQYTRQGVYTSSEGNMLRMWGEFGEYGANRVHPLGISFHWPDIWGEITPGENEQPRIAKLESLATLAAKVDIPLLWFGEGKINWRSGQGEVEIGEITYEGGGTFNTSLEWVDISNLEPKIQDLLGTDLSSKGAYKPKNKTINSFQAYTRQYLPTAFVIQDFDILTETKPGEPSAIVEIKRTRAHPSDWTPYADDWPNYYLQLALARGGGIEPLLLNHEKKFVEGHQVGFYHSMERPESPNTDNDRDFLDYNKEIIPVSEALTRLQSGDFDFNKS